MSRFKTIQKLFRLHNLSSQPEAPWVAEFRNTLGQIKGAIMLDLSALTANETRLVGDVDTLLAANAKAQADLKAANDALAAALAANDPAATKAAQDQIDAVAIALGDAANKIETGTAPADAPPAEDVPPAV